MTKITYLFLATLLVLSGCSSPETKNDRIINDSTKTRIDTALKSLIDSGRAVGITALIFEKNEEVYFKSVGFADRESNIPMDRSTLARIFSMTKPITGTALMQLYEKGAFQLDDPLSKYAPEFADMKVFTGLDAKGKMIFEPAKRPITIRDITRHTAGWASAGHPQLGEMVKDADVMNKENTLTQMAQKLSKLPLAFHPGDEWSYGISVDVQAYLVEKLSGRAFDQYVMENILNPLGMNKTRYVPEDIKALAAAYRRGEDGNLNRLPDSVANSFNGKEWPLKPGGFGLTSSVDDYMKFARMLVNKGTLDGVTILKPETVQLMSTNQLSDSVTKRMWLPDKGQVGFGIDFAVRLRPAQSEKENVGIVGEFFWDGAASTLFWVDPVNQLTAVLFLQVFPFDRKTHKKFRDAVYGEFKKVETKK